MNRGLKRALLGAIPVLLVVLLWWLLSGVRPSDEATRATVEITDLAVGVEVTGRLAAMETTLIGPPQIAEMYRLKISMMADEGTEVSEGSPVVAFDTTELEQKLQTRLTAAESARKEIEKKTVDLTVKRRNDELALAEAEAGLRKARLKTATPSELISTVEEQHARLDLERAEIEVDSGNRRMEADAAAGKAELEALSADLERAENDVRRIRDAITRMTRTAPRDGIVIHVTDWRNEKKKVGDVVHFRFMVVEIPDLDTMQAEGEVEEALAGKVEEGQKVSLRLDAHPDVEFKGTVSSISRSVQKKSWRNPLKIVRMEVALDQTDPEKMRPGMRFRGTIEVDKLREVLTIPLSAVFNSDEGPVAYRRTLMGYEEVRLDLGPRNTERVTVIDGLDEGDVVSTVRRPS